MKTIVGVMSDTHSNFSLMNDVASIMKEFGANIIFHLGDDMDDTNHINLSNISIFAVPGIYEQSYTNPNIENRKLIKIQEITFLLSHTPTIDGHDIKGDIDPEKAIINKKANILLHGHTHHYGIQKFHSGYIINPGHLKINDNRGNPPTFAILEIEDKKVDVKIYGIDGSLKISQLIKTE